METANLAQSFFQAPSRWRRKYPSELAQEPTAGVPILQQEFTDLRIVVEVAWGANLANSYTTWSWTDVTADVKYAQRVAITPGRQDESSLVQPATCTFTLDNRSGNYSKGGQSKNYPNVVRGTPIRIRIVYNEVSYTRFFGNAVGFKPSWDTTGKYAVVSVTAAGALRRLNQGTDPSLSVLRRYIPTLPNLVSYWPCEEGKNSPTFLNTVATGGPMNIRNAGNLASYNGLIASNPLPTIGTDIWTAFPGIYTQSGNGSVTFFLNTPATGYYAGTYGVAGGSLITEVLVNANSSSTAVAGFELYYPTEAANPGHVGFLAFDINFNPIGSASVFTNWALNGIGAYVTIGWTSSGGNVTFDVSYLPVGSFTAVTNSVTLTSRTIANISSIFFSGSINQSSAEIPGATIGHVAVWNAEISATAVSYGLNGQAGEEADARISRLCSENNELVNVVGSSHQRMGPQAVDSLVNLLRGCETVDGGMLCDGLDQGLRYYTRNTRINQTATMTLDASQGQIEQPFEPYDDDLLTVNTYQATRTNGSSYTYQQTTGPASISAVGNYTGSVSANFQSDGQPLKDYASWKVHLGTWNPNGYRYPALNLRLHHKPALMQQWLNMSLLDRIDVTNIDLVRTQMNNATLSLLMEGYTEIIDQFNWDITINCSDFDPWRIGSYAPLSNEFVMRMDTSGSTVVGGCGIGGTSITVATTSGPVWTTSAGDFPLTLDIGGMVVTATNITGSSSPQTFTLTGSTVVTSIAAGVSVAVHNPGVLGVQEV